MNVARALVFPLRELDWRQFRELAHLRGADDGDPGTGGWGYRRGVGHVHRGIDLKAPVGHEVVAVEDGWAQYWAAQVNAGAQGWNTAGHRVRLRGHSGAGYQYFHLGTSHASVRDAFPWGIRSGDVVLVRAGQLLGYLGHTGGSAATGRQVPPCSAHLHFQYHPAGVDGDDANPARLFERILPVGDLTGADR